MSPRGGPRPGSGRPRTEKGFVHVRCHPEKKRRWLEAADEDGQEWSDWVRRCLDRRADEVLGRE